MRPTPNRHFPANADPVGSNGQDLQALAEQVSDIAEKMSRLGTVPLSGVAPIAIDAGELRKMLDARRQRAHFFAHGLFADPAWDMLLDLLASHHSQLRVSVTSLCLASNVPSTTALRWIKSLENEGLISRRADRLDGRRHFVELTEKAEKALRDYFCSINVTLLL